jgi:hypothetical protein
MARMMTITTMIEGGMSSPIIRDKLYHHRSDRNTGARRRPRQEEPHSNQPVPADPKSLTLPTVAICCGGAAPCESPMGRPFRKKNVKKREIPTSCGFGRRDPQRIPTSCGISPGLIPKNFWGYPQNSFEFHVSSFQSRVVILLSKI